jgi:GT2 family glycosyltransferase
MSESNLVLEFPSIHKTFEKPAAAHAAGTGKRGRRQGWFVVGREGLIRGWCVDLADLSRRLTVEIKIDGAVAGTALADRCREKLVAENIGDGHYAFTFAVPSSFRDARSHTVEARVITPGYSDFVLQIKEARFSIDPSAIIPSVKLDRVTPEFLEGVLVGGDRGRARNLDVWIDGERLPEKFATTQWVKIDGARASFRIHLASRPLFELLSHAVTVSYPGVQELLGEADMVGPLVRVQVQSLALHRYRIELGSGIVVPSGFHLKVHLHDEERRRFASRSVAFDGATAMFDCSEDDLLSTVSIETDDGIKIVNEIPVRSGRRRMLVNGSFQRWTGEYPEDWQLSENTGVERSYYAFPLATRIERGLSGTTCIATVESGTFVPALLVQLLKRSLGWNDIPSEIPLSLIARASRPVELELRLVDSAGAPIVKAAFSVGTRWKFASKSVATSPGNGLPRAFAVSVRTPSWSQEPTPVHIEIAGLACGGEGHFDDIDCDRSVPSNLSDRNLAVNSDLLNWPNGLRVTARGSRFELAEGWTLFSRGSADSVATAITVPGQTGGSKYALALTVPIVQRYCRLEVSLETKEISGEGRLSFFGKLHENAAVTNRTQSESQWMLIDKIYVIKREMAKTSGGPTGTDSVHIQIARRVLLSKNWDNFTFDFNAAVDRFDHGKVFDVEEDRTIEYILAFEFTQPLSICIHSVDFRLKGPIREEGNSRPDAHPTAFDWSSCTAPSFEDRNIRAQVDTVQGLDRWNSAVVLRAPLHACKPLLAAETVERWNWKRSSLGSVDIGICVYNAVNETLACLASLVRSTTVPHTVRLINDGSERDCRERILNFIADKPWMKLYDNPENRGYTTSANRAVLESDADWVVLLNSDTMLASGWLEGLLEVAAKDSKTRFVGPVSNAATYQSIPELYDPAGKWMVNDLPETWTYTEIAEIVSSRSLRGFPEVPLLNGFCTLINRQAFEEIGGLNEKAFPAGYGEENDLCVRAAKAGHRLRVADHVYVYHSKSASFGSARRAELAKAGNVALKQLHPETDFGALGRRFLDTPSLSHLRKVLREIYADPFQSRTRFLLGETQ